MKKVFALAIMVVALVAVPFAVANPSSSIAKAYGGQSTPVVKVVGTKPVVKVAGTKTSSTSKPAKSAAVVTSAPAPVAKADQLPFTGIDLGVVLVAGVALAGVGFGMRRLSRQKD